MYGSVIRSILMCMWKFCQKKIQMVAKRFECGQRKTLFLENHSRQIGSYNLNVDAYN